MFTIPKMSVRSVLLSFMFCVILLAGSFGMSDTGKAQALPFLPVDDTPEGIIPYAGKLNSATDQPVENGLYDFSFALFDAESSGVPVWSEVQKGVEVKGGAFELALGSVRAIPSTYLYGGTRWLEVGVRGSNEIEFTVLHPRQVLNAVTPDAITQPTAGGTCPHDHVGEVWSANIPWSNGAFKVLNYANGPSIWGWNGGNGNGVRGYATGTGVGVYGESVNAAGTVGRSTNGRGVEGYSTNGYGILANSTNNDSIRVDGAGGNGVYVGSSGDHGVYVASAGWSGVSVASAAVAGVWVASAGQDGVLVSTAGWDGVHVVGPVGGSYFGSGMQGAEDFAVLNTGEVRSKVGFAAPTNDFAITLPVESDKISYEQGDVLTVSTSGSGGAERASVANSPAVVGIYSATPAFVGGRAVNDDAQTGGVTVAIMGTVSCKVSTENGPIRPGDLLVTSSTPGHAMRADNPQMGTVLGKALESLDSGTGLIQVLVMLR